MKILWVSSCFIYPLIYGRNIRSFKLMEKLGALHDITFVSFAKADDRQYFHKIENIVNKCRFIDFHSAKGGSPKFYLELIANLFSRLPYGIEKYKSASMKMAIADLMRKEKFDLVIFDFLASSINLDEKNKTPKIIFQHNVETLIWERMYKNQKNPFKKLFFFLQCLKMNGYEKGILKKFDACFAVSEKDKAYFQKKFCIENVKVIPTGVDVRYFSPSASEAEENSLIFVGSMDWLPNIDAASYFIKEVLPLVRREIASAEFYIAGNAPAKEVYDLARRSEGIIVTGTVDDLRGYIGKASVYVVPLRIGGGTRIKIYEAMAMGKAVVSTSIGAEGLSIINNENIIIADGENEFAEAVIRLLNDQEFRNRIERNARKYVEENCSWDRAAEAFSKYCEEIRLGFLKIT